MPDSKHIMESEKIRYVVLVPYDPSWAEQFKSEAEKIQHLLGENCHGIHHIGSTAIPNIYAKPLIDLLIEVNDLSRVDALNSAFEALDYICMGEYGIPGRRYYWKSKAQRTHHIHLFEKNSSELVRHLAFRDYMIEHPDEARAYSWIKRSLAEQFPDDIVSYVNGKESFVRIIDYRTGFAKKDQLTASDDIFLESYNPNWKKLAAAEINAIKETVPFDFLRIEHLGSTAVEGLSAKPVIDIFIALKSIDEAESWIKPLEALGYVYWAENPDKTHHRYFKGMPPFGLRRTHHVHIMPMGDDFERRVAFRDLLIQHTDLRQRYEALKCELAKEHSTDREAYTDAKGKFIKDVLENYK